jgi:ribosomal protein S18 acetylase RimI-like enzyme
MIEDRLTSKYGKYLKALDIYENKTSLILSKIIINDELRGEGIGSKIMVDLVNYADTNNQIIALTPSNDFGGNKNSLIRFYKKFGFKANKGNYKSFEFHESMIRYPKVNEWSMVNEDKLKGGLADKMSNKDIAKKFGITIAKLNKEVKMGEDVEMEHVTNKTLSREIAMDHLVEIPDYYTRLKKMEKEGEKYWKGKSKQINESIKNFIKRRIRENIKLIKKQPLNEEVVADKIKCDKCGWSWDIKDGGDDLHICHKCGYDNKANISLSLMDETPVTTAFNIMYDRNIAGQIEVGKFNNKLNDDDLEIVLIKVEPQFRGLKLGTETIKALWGKFPKINRFILMPTPESKNFWSKIGAIRLNDTYYMINRS